MKRNKHFGFIAIAALMALCGLFVGCDIDKVLGYYTVTFDTNGGSPSVIEQTVQKGNTIVRPIDPVKFGYDFAGWYRDNRTFNYEWDFDRTIPSNHITLYAKYTEAVFLETPILSVDLTLTPPTTRSAPDTAVIVPNNSNYTVAEVIWTSENAAWSVNDPFLGNTEYTATIMLLADDGYSFAGLVYAGINNAVADILDNTSDAVLVSYKFPKTLPGEVVNVTITSQPAKLVYTHGDALNLAGLAVTLSFSDGTWEENIPLTNFGSYGLVTEPANSTVLSYTSHNGKPVVVRHGGITANTGNLVINKAAINSVSVSITPAAMNAMPNIEARVQNNSNYTAGDVTWTGAAWGDNGRFLGETEYTATVTLTANNDYTFTGLTIANINNTREAAISNNTGTTVMLSASWTTIDKEVTGISILTEPAKLVYIHGDTLNLSGLAVKLTYGDLTFDNISFADFSGFEGLMTNPMNGELLSRTSHNNSRVIASYGDLSAVSASTLTINRADPVVSWPTGLTVNYGQTLFNNMLPDGFTWTNGEVPVSNTGLHNVTFTPADTDNYNIRTQNVTVTVLNVIVDTGYITSYLGSQPGGETVGNPVPLKMKITDNTNWWPILLSYLNAAGKYVALDLSDCTGMQIFNPGTANTGERFIVSLVLPDTTNVIQEGTITVYAFRFFTELREVTGANVTLIGECTFGSTKLTNVSFPKATSIGRGAFAWCHNLTSVFFPAVTSIGRDAFYECGNLTSVSFPAATIIDYGAFTRCPKLTNIDFPEVVTIGQIAFIECTSLTSVDFPVATSIGDGAFQLCTNLTSVSFPAATSINYCAFHSCYNLTSAFFPLVTSIGISAFAYSGLTSVDFPEAISIGNYAFHDNTSLTSVYFPKATSLGVEPFQRCTKLENVTLGVTNTPTSFLHDTGLVNSPLKHISFPAATTIGVNAFIERPNLTSVSFPKAISMGQGAFARCPKLTTIDFPALTTIGRWAFVDCTSLTSVSFPKATNVVWDALQGCSNLTSVSFASVTSIGYEAFYGFTRLTSADFPLVTYIDGSAFRECHSLTSVSIPRVTYLEGAAFRNCISLTSISIPLVTGIRNNAFRDCHSLVRVTLGNISDFSDTNVFPGNLRSVYRAAGGGAGTYVRAAGSSSWSKQ